MYEFGIGSLFHICIVVTRFVRFVAIVLICIIAFHFHVGRVSSRTIYLSIYIIYRHCGIGWWEGGQNHIPQSE